MPSNRSSEPLPAAELASNSRVHREILPSTHKRVPLHLHHLSSAEELSSHSGEAVLGEIRFGTAAARKVPTARPVAHVTMEQSDAATVVELWTSNLPVQYADTCGIQYATDGVFLFGTVCDATAVESVEFESRIQKIYRDIFRLTEMQGYPHLLRMWNYIPDINRHHNGLENYQRFCHARSQAFQEHYGEFTFLLPSASAVGTRQGQFVMYFIASCKAGVQRENPRQVSAYRYPPQYGRRSPSFARATLNHMHGAEFLFISGTASIVGHQSLHTGDFQAQLDETLRNIAALIESTAADENTRFRSFTDVDYFKIYLRHASDMEIARETIHRRIGARVRTLFLTGDICRQELLVEVEAVIGCR